MHRYDFIEVTRAIQKELPKEAFRPSGASVSTHLPAHVLIIVACYFLIRESDQSWLWTLATVVAGHSCFMLGNMAHTIAHRCVIRNRVGLYLLEALCWSFLLGPPTVWRLIHNAYHHKHTNARNDSQYGRRYTRSERTWFRSLYMFLIFPHRYLPGNPLVLLFQGLYIELNVPHLLFAAKGSNGFERVSLRDKAFIVLELGALALIQVGLYWSVGGDVTRYLLVGIAPPVLGACFSSVYTHTEHSARQVTERHDPLHGSQSLYLPRWMDWMHQNLSHHVEHHLFPGVHPRYYPAVREVLERRFASDYQVATLSEAWREVWSCNVFGDDPPSAERVAQSTSPASQTIPAE